MNIEILELSETEQLKLQRLADAIASLKTQEAETSAKLDAAKDELYEVFDGLRDRNAYLVYESLDPHRGWRLVREISYPRSFDLDGLHHALSPRQFKAITRVIIDTDAVDLAVKRGEIAAGVVERYTRRTARARGPLWKPAAGDLHLEPGQLAVILRPDQPQMELT